MLVAHKVIAENYDTLLSLAKGAVRHGWTASVDATGDLDALAAAYKDKQAVFEAHGVTMEDRAEAGQRKIILHGPKGAIPTAVREALGDDMVGVVKGGNTPTAPVVL